MEATKEKLTIRETEPLRKKKALPIWTFISLEVSSVLWCNGTEQTTV